MNKYIDNSTRHFRNVESMHKVLLEKKQSKLPVPIIYKTLNIMRFAEKAKN